VKVLINIICIGALFTACEPENSDAERRLEVMQTDKRFSEMATEKGIAEAFIYYADEKVIKPTPGKQPVVGKFALMKWYEANPPGDEKLVWYPLRGEASGNLGYTFGGYELHTKTATGSDTVFYGNYVSVWRRKSDGNWRYVVDTGSATDGPVTLK